MEIDKNCYLFKMLPMPMLRLFVTGQQQKSRMTFSTVISYSYLNNMGLAYCLLPPFMLLIYTRHSININFIA